MPKSCWDWQTIKGNQAIEFYSEELELNKTFGELQQKRRNEIEEGKYSGKETRFEKKF